MTAEPSDAGVSIASDAADATDPAGVPDAWLRSYAAGLGAAVRPDAPVRRVRTPSRALVVHLDDVVIKLHHPRTDPVALAARLAVVDNLAEQDLFVQPLSAAVAVEPVSGRLVTAWPRVEVLDPEDDELPWAAAGALLARLHRAPLDTAMTVSAGHGGGERLARALERVASLRIGADARGVLSTLGQRLVAELKGTDHQGNSRTRLPTGTPPSTVVHGDWHLGQLARIDRGWRLLDVDDVGLGDPAWDLGRPAGFWAAGLLGDEDWNAFIDAYRSSGGPGVPADGDPWPRLDLAARCAVFVTAVRELGIQPRHSGISASALLRACTRM